MEFPNSANDPRNIRSSLASDGFSTFSACSQSYFILSTIIPGPTSLGNDIDVYLQPLVKELNELWNDGVEEFNSESKTIFSCVRW